MGRGSEGCTCGRERFGPWRSPEDCGLSLLVTLAAVLLGVVAIVPILVMQGRASVMIVPIFLNAVITFMIVVDRLLVGRRPSRGKSRRTRKVRRKEVPDPGPPHGDTDPWHASGDDMSPPQAA